MPAAASKKKKFYIFFGMGLTMLILFLLSRAQNEAGFKKQALAPNSEPIKLNDWIRTGFAKKFQTETSVSASTSAPPIETNPQIDDQLLKDIFEREDICALVRHDFYSTTFTHAHFASKDTSVLLDLIRTGESLEVRAFTGKPIVEIFIRALYYSGLITGGRGTSVLDKEKADLLWEELYTKDPENGAIDYYFMAYQSKLGANLESLTKIAESMTAKPKFENYYFELTRRIYEDSLKGPVHWAVGAGIVAELPIPDMVEGFLVLKKIVKTTADANLKKRISDWAHRQISIPTKLQGELEMVEWSALDLGISLKVLKKLGENVPDYKDYIEQKLRREWSEPESKAMEDIFDYEKKGCSATKLEEVIRRQRDLYERARRMSQ